MTKEEISDYLGGYTVIFKAIAAASTPGPGQNIVTVSVDKFLQSIADWKVREEQGEISV